MSHLRMLSSILSRTQLILLVLAIMSIYNTSFTNGTQVSAVSRRGYEQIDPRKMSCERAFQSSAMIGTTMYLDGGFFWYNNGTDVSDSKSNHVGPIIWTRKIDTSIRFDPGKRDEVPITYIERPSEALEVSSGQLWAYEGMLYQIGGYVEFADRKYPGFTAWKSDRLEEVWRYDTNTNLWTQVQQNPNTTDGKPIHRIEYSQSVVIPSLGKGYLISGQTAVEPTARDLTGMLIFDFKTQTWENQSTPWRAWAKGLVHHLPVGDGPGFLVGLSGQGREDGNMRKIEVFDLKSGVWGPVQDATAAQTLSNTPAARISACSVIVPAPDGSSYNIYVYGGHGAYQNAYNDVWILSIPSFKWFLAHGGYSYNQPGEPAHGRDGMSCELVADGRKMLVYGGRRLPDFSAKCDPIGIYIFDLTTLQWEEHYYPNSGEYKVPQLVYDVIGGGPEGAASLMAEGGLVNPQMEEAFEKAISTNAQLSTAAITGIVVGTVCGLLILVLIFNWYRTTRSTQKHKNMTSEAASDQTNAEPESVLELHSESLVYEGSFHELSAIVPTPELDITEQSQHPGRLSVEIPTSGIE